MKDFPDELSKICVPETDKPRVIVIGAGFAGLNFVKKCKRDTLQTVILDKNNYHQFTPLIYQVATSGLEPDSVIFPLRKLFKDYKEVAFRMAEVLEIDLENKYVQTNIGWLDYDYLVIASGSMTNFFGLDQIKSNCYGLKSVNDSINIRSLVLQSLERASITCDPEERDTLTNFVVVGGGPAGVELAGALAEFRRHIIPVDYPEFDEEVMKIYLIDHGDRLVKMMSEKSSRQTLKDLQKFDVEVIFNSHVDGYDGETVEVSNCDPLKAGTLIWTAGVKGDFPKGMSKAHIVKGNRIKVDDFCRVEGYQNVYAIGDVAGMVKEDLPKGHPMLAPVAIQQGEYLAKCLSELVKGKEIKPFKYHDRGSMATIGRKKAVIDTKNKHFKGLLAWLIWAVVHVSYLLGFKNKVFVLISWTINYFTYDRGDRLITRQLEDKFLLNNLNRFKKEPKDLQKSNA